MDEHFFENIDTEEKAYFLGLIIADGNVFIDERNKHQASVSITLDEHDEYMLLKFKECVGLSSNVAHDGRGASTMAVRSNIMADDLKKYGVIPRKSFFTYLPNVPENMMRHLIRGIFDGDGSIQAKQLSNGRYLHSFSFCGTHKLMQDIIDEVQKHIYLNVIPKVYDYKTRRLSEIKFQSVGDMYIFGEWIYDDAHIYLNRKFDKYDQFKLHYDKI